MLGVEDRAVEPLGGRLGGDDGLLGLLGESFELHGAPLDRKSVLAGVGLVDEVEERPGRGLRLVRQVGRQDDAGLDVQVAVAARPEPGHPLAGEPERAAGLGPGRDRSATTPPFRVSTLTSAAEERLLERQRELALEVGAAPA